MNGMNVVSALEKDRGERSSLPKSITADNWSKLSSRALEIWVIEHDPVVFHSGRAGQWRTDSSSFNGGLGDVCGDVEWFSSLEGARQELAKFHEPLQSPASA
jgi:hypothetical protein